MRRLLFVLLAAVCLIAPQTVAQDDDSIADLDARAARKSRAEGAARLTLPSNAARADIVAGFLRDGHGLAGVTAASAVVETENTREGGRVVLRMRQRVAGLEVYGTEVKAFMTAAGELISVVENLADASAVLQPALIDYADALNAVLAQKYPGSGSLQERSSEENRVIYQRNGLFYRDPMVTRVAVPERGGRLRVGYLVETWDTGNVLWHTVVSGRGRIIFEQLRTASDRYNVFTNQPLITPQQIVDVTSTPFSPSGWVASNTTIGNNVDAYLDADNTNSADANSRPVSSTKEFLTVADLGVAPTTTSNRLVAVTNLFYLNNVIHDKLYRHGFNEAAGNFQTNNFGLGGAGNDPVNAEAQDGADVFCFPYPCRNNANFATPADGSRPRMQMYLWTTATPNRDGDVDSDIVYHEYGHGLTWRMIGGMSGKISGAIGEGMSDVVALYINDDDAVAEYSNNRATGIRRARYTDYKENTGRTYGDALGSSVHNDGEIYAATMWKLLELWEARGWSRDTLWDRVIGGMNHTPSSPAFEDMRDGILTEITDAAEECVVWEAFAHYGVGVGADGRQSPSFSITESFAMPASCSGTPNTAPTVTITSPANNSSWQQGAAVSFTGSASDTEDGSISASLVWTSSLQGQIGTGGSFSRSDLVVGTHTITAAVLDSGGLQGTASISITITSASGAITLSTAGYKVKGVRHADLTWSGATGSVDIWRNGVKILAATVNDGFHTDVIGGKGGGSFTYQVCPAGLLSGCSATSTVVF